MLSPRHIYDTYLRGPGAIIRLFEQTFGTQSLCGRPTPSQQQEVIGMALLVIEDETTDHIEVSFFGRDAIMSPADGRAHLIEQR